jgi:hypothetical protein
LFRIENVLKADFDKIPFACISLFKFCLKSIFLCFPFITFSNDQMMIGEEIQMPSTVKIQMAEKISEP